MTQLRLNHEEFSELATEVIVIGPEAPPIFCDYWQKQAMPFPGIPDPDHIIADLYGQQVRLLKLGRLPALMLIDKTGLLILSHYGKSMTDIPAVDDILMKIKQLN